MQLRSIEIDFDIYKMIENERRSFDEPPHIALRRLLNLPEATSSQDVATRKNGKPFVQDGVSIPHGSFARMEYLRGSQIYEGQFLDGYLVVDGYKFTSLSAAAMALAVTKDGSKPSLNGWLYWKVKYPDENQWRSLQSIRADARL